MKIILFIDLLYPTEHAFIENVFTQNLPQSGYKIDCIVRTQKKNQGPISWNRMTLFPYFVGDGFSPVYNILSRLKILIDCFIRNRKKPYDIVFVRNWEYGGFIAILFKKFFKTVFFYQRTFPTDRNYREFVFNKQNNFLKRLVKSFLLYVYPRIIKKADFILPISNEMKKEMIREGYNPEILFPFGLGYDDKVQINPQRIELIRKEFGGSTKKILLYFGKMDRNRNLEFLIEVVKELNREDVVLIMLGGNGEDINRLNNYAIQNVLEQKIKFPGKVKREDVPDYISASYLTISPIPPTERYNVASPTKLFESLGLGVPVIGNDLPVQKEVLAGSGGGICIQYDKDQFVGAITYLLDNPGIREEMSSKAKKFINENYTYDILAKRLDDLFVEKVRGIRNET